METNASTSGRQGWATRVCETDGETMISRETNGGRKTAAVKRPPSIINPRAIRLSINSLGVLPISALRNNKKTVIYESAARKRWRHPRSRLASFVRLILPFRWIIHDCICARNNSDFIETFSREKNRPHKKLDISVVSRDSSSKIKREEKFWRMLKKIFSPDESVDDSSRKLGKL